MESGKFRGECLNMEWFLSRREARVIIEQYRRQYNEERPHSSLDYRTPAEVEAMGATSQSEGLTLLGVR
jgi:putative transposase